MAFFGGGASVDLPRTRIAMKYLALAILLSSCSPKNEQPSDLPRYSDMGAAADAGRVEGK